MNSLKTDMVYLCGDVYDFEYLHNVDWAQLNKIAKIYGKKPLENRIAQLEKIYA